MPRRLLLGALLAGLAPSTTPSLAHEITGERIGGGLIESATTAEYSLFPITHPLPSPIQDENGSESSSSSANGDSESSEGESASETPDVETLNKRLEELEASWKEHQEELEAEAADESKRPTLDIGGRIHFDQWSFFDNSPGTNFLETGDVDEGPEDRWAFRRIRLELQGTVPDNMLYRMQIDFNNPSTPDFKDVYLGFDGLPHNQSLLIGNQKRPIGLDHLNSSRHNVFAERPLAVEAFNEDSRRVGACLYGYTDDEAFNWQYGLFLLENMSTTGRAIGDYDQAGLYGRVSASPWYDEISGGRGYLHWGIAGSINQTDGDGTIDSGQNSNEARFRSRPQGRTDSRWWDTNRILGAENYEQLGFESIVNIGSLQIVGEYLHTWVQRDPLGGFAGDDLHFHGGYLYVNYFLTGEFIPLDRQSGTIDRVRLLENFFLVERCRGGIGNGWGALSVALRYDYVDLVDSDIQGGVGHTWTVGVNWHWTDYSKLQTNLTWGEIDEAGEGRTPIAGAAPDVAGDFGLLGMRYMLDF